MNKTFRQYLKEEENLTLEQGLKVLQMLYGYQFTIKGDRVDSSQSISMNFTQKRWFKGAHLPVKFGRIEGNFEAANMDLGYTEELPTFVKGNCYINNNGFNTHKGFPEFVGGRLAIYDNPELLTYSGIHNSVKYCNRGMTISPYHCAMLGFLLINYNPTMSDGSFLNFDITVNLNDPHNELAFKAIQIINDCKNAATDLLDCKIELIEKGLSVFAKL
ncbi:MAG: hypothetical protein QXN55_01065 [Candidatus Nitrosotenuis sp.]